MLRLSDFDYELPRELIAQYPLKERDSCRLMVVERKGGNIRHCAFGDIAGLLRRDDLLVLNDTKVLPSRLFGFRLTGGKVEVLLLGRKNGATYAAMIKPGRTKLNERIQFDSGKLCGVVTARGEITFEAKSPREVYSHGVMPLPPYIKRPAEPLDNEYYQTVYAAQEGAIASPTAGLHFTDELLRKLKGQGVEIARLTLHVGLGTFKPVTCEDVAQHKVEAEYMRISSETATRLTEARERKGRIVCVGTTSCRALESYARGTVEGYTGLFIYPPFEFKLTDCLLTNFHLPRTTLFMLVSAFAGPQLIKEAYREAVEAKYRFYSYGDAMLIV